VSLFSEQIKELITTMLKVAPSSLNMREWFEYKVEESKCGYVACICGQQATMIKSKLFTYDKRNTFKNQAKDIAESLDEACRNDIGSAYLSRSIYEADVGERLYLAKATKMFTDSEMHHPHLLKTRPTPEEVVSYMRMVLKKLNDYNQLMLMINKTTETIK
jgi:hypothetical protein